MQRRIRAPDTRRERGADDLVVDAPPDVLGPGLPAVGPPGVLLGVLIDDTERIDPAGLFDDLVHPRAFFGKKPGILLVGTPVLQVHRLVGDVPVAAEDVIATGGQTLIEIRQKAVQKAELDGLPFLAGRARRQVQRDHAELAEPGFQVAPLAVHVHPAESLDHVIGLDPRIQADPAVALLFGLEVIAGVAFGPELRVLQLLILPLDLLQADHIGILSRKPGEKALLRGRADAVDVQRDDAQTGMMAVGDSMVSGGATWRANRPHTAGDLRR